MSIDGKFEFSPPPGWSIFGSHVGVEGLLEFYGSQFTEDGMPMWERPVEELEWEYVPGWIGDDGRARISQGAIAPGYVAEFISEGGEVVRRKVSRFESVTSDTAPTKRDAE